METGLVLQQIKCVLLARWALSDAIRSASVQDTLCKWYQLISSWCYSMMQSYDRSCGILHFVDFWIDTGWKVKLTRSPNYRAINGSFTGTKKKLFTSRIDALDEKAYRKLPRNLICSYWTNSTRDFPVSSSNCHRAMIRCIELQSL